MAHVKVFVDDAVLGRLPQVCAKSGTATDSQLRIIHHVGQQGSRLLWLLIFAGPIGWIALALVLPQGSDEKLAIKVPLSDARYDRLTEARRRRNHTSAAAALVVAVVLVLLWVSSGGIGSAGLLLFGASVVGAIVVQTTADRQFSRESVGVELDASRRWVTLRRVHPDFAAACADQRSSHQPA